MDHDVFVPCTLKRLSPEHHVAAARTAIQINPANTPLMMGLVAAAPARLALLTKKYWGAKGVRLTVGFLDTSDAALKAKILLHMNAWAQHANVVFSESRSSPQVRIARAVDGYWSYLGTDILSIPSNQPTMNLQSFTLDTPDSEYHRVVRHETGHTLGFPHEHARRAIVERLDPAKTIAYFERTQGWSADEIRAQVLTPLEESEFLATTSADVMSIMAYQLPGSITVDGQPIPGGTDIDPSDFTLAAQVYPQVVAPPPPPPPPPHGGPTVADVRGVVDAAMAAVVRQQRPICRGAVQAAQMAADAAIVKLFS